MSKTTQKRYQNFFTAIVHRSMAARPPTDGRSHTERGTRVHRTMSDVNPMFLYYEYLYLDSLFNTINNQKQPTFKQADCLFTALHTFYCSFARNRLFLCLFYIELLIISFFT